MPVETSIKLRKGTSVEWSNTNPVLASGEPGYDLTNKILKIGNGINNWNNLSLIYANLNDQATIDCGLITYTTTTTTQPPALLSFVYDKEKLYTWH